MVDIAASLSLTPSSLPLDQAAILGAETADIQAFGDILAGQIAGQPTSAPAAAPFDLQLPTLPLPAGNRQPAGKILPGAVQILPPQVSFDAAPIDVAAPSAQIPQAEAPSAAPAPAPVATKPVLTTLALRLAAPQPRGTELVLPETATAEAPAQPAAANPVHALLKMVATAIRTPRQAADEAPALPAEQDAAAETDSAEPALPAAATPATATVAIAIPVLPILVAPTLQPAGPAAEGTPAAVPQAVPAQGFKAHPVKSQANPAVTAALLPAATPQLTETAPRDQVLPNQSPPAASPSVAPQAVAAAKVETPSVPVLTVAAIPAETAKAAVAAASAVALTPAPLRPAAPVTTARIKVASREPTEGQTLAADRLTASLTPAADRAAIVDRVMPAAMPLVTDGQQSATAAQATPAAAAGSAAPVATAPTVEMPRHDFAALVERLVEARNAAAPASTHASINHAEFGQVSLHFQQDGNDLKVGMTSADPGFAAAVQAAMPAERQNMNADTQQRGQGNQSSGQSQNQSASTSSNSNHEAAGQRGTDTAGENGGRGQGRNSRGGSNNSNPSQRWTGEQPQSRGGIFA